MNDYACSLKYNGHVLVLDLFANSPYANRLFILHNRLLDYLALLESFFGVHNYTIM